ncbi:MAG: hypothetical protein OEX19_17075 [Gammaproteobacteria bacterium]|nr:hypothetical protein [Gammaproteobacteria bacterium]
MFHNFGWWVVAPTGEALFVYSNKKYSKNAAHYNLPKKWASLNSQLCLRVGLTRNPARRPQFAVLGELTLPKLKAEAGCVGEGKVKNK